MRIKDSLRFVICMLAFIPFLPASGEVYAGLSAGSSDHAVSNESDTAFTIFAAIRLTERIMLEGGPVYPGRLWPNEPATKGFSIQALGLFPVGEKFELFVKGGLYDWEVDRQDTRLYEGRDPMLGIGMHRYFGEDMAFRAEINRYSDVRSGDLDLLMIGVVLWFPNLGN